MYQRLKGLVHQSLRHFPETKKCNNMRQKLLIILISVLIPTISIHSGPKFVQNGFEFEVLHTGDVLISWGYKSHISKKPAQEVFQIPSSIEYQGKTYKVQGIAPNGFAGCTDIQHLVIDDGIRSIADYAFQCCINLKSVRIPASVSGVGKRLFSGCQNLKSIVVDSKNEDLDSRDSCNAIIDSENDELIVACPATTIPSSITSIGQGAFSGCENIYEINIPEGVHKIDNEAFSACINLKHITLPQSLETIGYFAFGGCKSLRSLYLPKNIKSIDSEKIFAGCDSLSSIVVDKDNKIYDSRQECNAIIETKSSKVIAGCPTSKLVEGLKEIGDFAFQGTQLREIVIPPSMTQISAEAFYDCDALSRITVNRDNPKYESPGGCNAIIRKDSDILILGCANTIIPERIKEIGNDAFAGRPVAKETLRLPDGLTSIGEGAFSHCDNLFEIIIPQSVTSIGEYAFVYCPHLAVVQLPGRIKELKEEVFSGCEKLAVVDIPESVSIIRHFAFYNCKNLIYINLPSSITSVEKGAFYGCPCENDIKNLKLHFIVPTY
jgi:hypothetical protein